MFQSSEPESWSFEFRNEAFYELLFPAVNTDYLCFERSSKRYEISSRSLYRNGFRLWYYSRGILITYAGSRCDFSDVLSRVSRAWSHLKSCRLYRSRAFIDFSWRHAPSYRLSVRPIVASCRMSLDISYQSSAKPVG